MGMCYKHLKRCRNTRLMLENVYGIQCVLEDLCVPQLIDFGQVSTINFVCTTADKLVPQLGLILILKSANGVIRNYI